ncbi:MAG: DUF1887 family protein [Ruminococcaceae bacterium]|nr:DUF1887 family protein [Oscillospiraceae bacterium]
MTIVEFYDKTSIENIASALLCKPDKVIFVGNDSKQMEKSKRIYEDILRSRGIATQLECKSVSRNKLQDIIAYLESVIKTNEDCVFDLTGGEDLYLVAVGMLMEKYKGKISSHRFNLQNEKLLDCDMDGNVCATGSFDISVEENINMYGGEVVRDSSREQYTYEWRFSKDFIDDVEAMWEICKGDSNRNEVALWNIHTETLGEIYKDFGDPNSLDFSFDVNVAKSALTHKKKEYVLIPSLLYKLQNKRLISSLSIGETVSFRFKNEQVKKCLIVAGQVLELIVAIKMRALKDKDGSPLYHDVKVGVVIDWDGRYGVDEIRTINEIDVIAMKGMVPVFISCKNGKFKSDELYKLNTVTTRFGNAYAKKVLVTSQLERLEDRRELKARMIDMGIRCIDDVDSILDEQFSADLKNILS